MTDRHITEALGSIREVSAEDRIIGGIAIPYGVLSGPTELYVGSGQVVREAWAPGAFRDSVTSWSARRDGGRMAYRPAHREKPVGTVQSLEETPDGVAFRARIFKTPAGDEYLDQVREGLNGVSVETDMPGGTVKMRDGTLLHRAGKLVAIAGSVNPAFDGARIALRDMEEVMNETPAPEPTPTPPPAPTPEPTPEPIAANRDLVTVSRASLERAGVTAMIGDVRITRPELVYNRDSAFTYIGDTWLAANRDSAAGERVHKHQSWLGELATKMERDAYSRIFDPGVAERAGDVLSSEIPGAYPTDFVPGLLTPRILKGRPMGSFFQRIPIADARPRTFPKVTTSTTVAVQSAEGAALSAVDLATTAVTVTPLIYGAYTDVSRQALDGADPSVLSIIYQDLVEAYAQASETVIKTAVEAGATASGTAITAATPWAGELANVIKYYATRFKPAQAAFIPSALYSVLLSQGDTTGRPFMPMLGAMNSDGTVEQGAIAGNILGAKALLSYASTVNVNVFAVPADYVIFESAIAQFQYDQIVGPQAVRVGLWAYLVVGTRLGGLSVTAA
jgi:hypothetical protein